MAMQQNTEVSLYLANLVNQIRSSSLSHEERVIVRRHILDSIATAYIGCRNAIFHDMVALCGMTPKGDPGSGISAEGNSPPDAAMLWAYAINGSVFEGGSREGACHPAAAAVSTFIAYSAGKTWDDIDKAVVAGYEVMVRLARSGNPGFTEKGFHPTSIVAPCGAAAAASILFGYDVSKIQQSLCLAVMGSAGLMTSFRSGDTQPLQVAWAVRCGLIAALIAGAGHRGYPRIFEEGFYPAYLGHTPNPPVHEPLEYKYAIQGSYIKPYPGCRHVHPSIDALEEILKDRPINHERIQSIKVQTYKIAVETEIEPVRSRGDAYFNIPYALAARIILGDSDWDAFDEKHLNDERLLGLMRKIHVEMDPVIERAYPKQRGAAVTLKLSDGHVYHGRAVHPRGEPENPFPDALLKKKFRTAAAPFLSEESMDQVETILEPCNTNIQPERIIRIACHNSHA